MADTGDSDSGFQKILARAKGIILQPAEEWPQIKAEQGSCTAILKSYALPLIAIGPVASFLGGQIFGYGILGFSFRPSIAGALAATVTQFVLAVAGVFLLSFIANFLAPRFGGKDDFAQSFRLVAYSMTAAWIAGVFGIVPTLAILGLLGLYSIYIFYTGATTMMNVPAEKAGGYTAATFVAAFVLFLVIGAASGAVTRSFAPDPFDNDYALNGSASPAEPG